MLFNSLDFAIFLPIVFILYWFVTNKNLKLQNILIVASSFVFYGWWDWRFLLLMIASASVDYIVGIKLKSQNILKKRKLLLSLSIIANLGILVFFKYFNFFVDNFIDAFTILGLKFKPLTLKVILPVGISFYTFQALSYTIDVYKKNLEPTKDPISYFAFISFFPQLVAGPIERATNLLPQFYNKRTFDYEKAIDGAKQILWGLFKKIVIADTASYYVKIIFDNYDTMPASALFLGSIFFAFQIYGDFSGYSDIAIGTARLFGFTLMRNFAYPYFSRDIAEFWRRWHISLSTWFRDYIYIPLGGSKVNTLLKIRNTFIIFLLSGFWHGANWTYIFWGGLNALYFIPLLLFNKNRNNITIVSENKILPSLKDLLKISLTFFMTLIAWIFFRSNTLSDAFIYISNMLSPDIVNFSEGFTAISTRFSQIALLLFYILVLVSIEWIQRTKQHGLEFKKSERFSVNLLKYSLFFVISLLIILNIPNQAVDFIYFQF